MMDNNISNDCSKKTNLEELSKEDLIKRCKNLLLIAQKAKQSKDTLQEENNKLKSELAYRISSANEASQEIIEKLTQQKLTFVTTVEDLKSKNSSLSAKLQLFEFELQTLQEKFSSVDNENVAYKRQITRLTDENEQLITHLDTLEKQIDKLNKIGIQQQKQLLELEESKSLDKNLVDEEKISELQSMLSISLEEVKKLKSENINIIEKLQNCQINLTEKDKNIVVISDELKSKGDSLKKITDELNELKTVKEAENSISKEYDNLKLQYQDLTNVIKGLREDNELKHDKGIKELQDTNNKLKEKLKMYHAKIVKFAGNTKALKEEKNNILQLFSLYTDQVKYWKEQLHTAGQNLVTRVNLIETENKRLKQDINILRQKEESEVTKNSCILEEKSTLEKKFNDTISEYEKQLQDVKVKNEKELDFFKSSNDDLKKIIQDNQFKFRDGIQTMKEQNADLLKQLEEGRLKHAKLEDENEILLKMNNELKKEISLLSEEINNTNVIMKDQDEALKKQFEEQQNKVSCYEKLIKDLEFKIKSYDDDREHKEATEKQLAERSGEEIKKLVQENKYLSSMVDDLQSKLSNLQKSHPTSSHVCTQTEGDLTPCDELEEQLINLKRENTELLSEMNEMNQAIKERGESISKLEAHCEEVMKKLQIYETQANKNVDSITQKETIIKKLTEEIESLKLNRTDNINLNQQVNSAKDEEIISLKNEIENLKEKLNTSLDTNYAESETMSTSTLSKTDEVNRLKDLEGSWEERYGKLRNLAIKLKGKIRELTKTMTQQQNEKEELQKKLSANIKTIQTLQNQSDKIEDELENSKQQCKQYLNRLNTIAEDISKDKQLLVSKDDTIGELQKEIEIMKSEKQTMEIWKKQVSAKVQTLRKELEVNNTLKKEHEAQISKLTTDFEAKEQALKNEIENHKQTKLLLDQSNNECKKNSVLSLEMQDYERSVKETAKKLEKQQEQISQLKGQVESQKTTVNALREQNKLLEERAKDEENNLNAAKTEINTYKKKITSLEQDVEQKENGIHSITQLLETTRSENEELSTELSKVIAEHQKANNILKNERDHLRSQALGFQQNLRDLQDILKLKEDELKVIQNDYEGYKVRAQSVLRQNQNRDVGLEEKLYEEVNTLKAQNCTLNNLLKDRDGTVKLLEDAFAELTSNKRDCDKKVEELENEIENVKAQHVQLSSKHEKALSEHAETVRSLKVHADTLSQCYRQQISEQEVRHNREIIELQSRLEKAPSPIETNLVPLTTVREEGEGSESVESNNAPNVHPIPLERLLGSDYDQEVTLMKKQLTEQESKVIHLTALLSDTEQDLAKHVQMNKLLKEEIRRQQRSVEREEHAENLEYLKNIVFKFVTLNSGDERARLVPVLNTILKLSPEETKKLSIVAKSEVGIKGWANYLPTWSSPSKPQ